MIATFFAAMMMVQGLDETGTAVARPIGQAVLEPVSGSYFQIFEFYGRKPHTWRHARRMVKGYHHEGREGRLAFVKDGTTHYFLILNFDLLRQAKMWIGLSAECNEQADLKWLDETMLADTNFRAWSSVAQKNIREQCRRLKDTGTQLPIFYEPTDFGVRWEMAGPKTDIRYMMVEFPVPTEEDAAADQQQGSD